MARTRRDIGAVENEFNGTSLTPIPRYLARERLIPEGVITSPRFANCIRIDDRQNAVFPHHDQKGLCGLEKENLNFTEFPSGREKGLWLSNQFPDDTAMVICESATECLSYATLFPSETTRYVSIAGRMSPNQVELVKSEIEKMPAESTIIPAMNQDLAGRKLAVQIGDAFMEVFLAVMFERRLFFITNFPQAEGTGWNDTLKARSQEGPVPGL